MAAAYSTAAMTASTIPGVKLPDWPVSSATPPMATSALTAVAALGSLCRSTASAMGTRMMAVFSSRETVEEGVLLSPVSSVESIRKNRAPMMAPRTSVWRLMWRRRLKNTTASSTKAIKNRAASRLKIPMPFMAILLNRRDVARAAITAAKRISAFF